MGKIDKEKLLETLEPNGVKCTGLIYSIIENFPEEQPIDFDALYKEYSKSHQSISIQGFIDFLKSKNLTAPKPVEIPVKKTWTLKPETKKILDAFGAKYYETIVDNNDPDLLPFYDLHEEPDYSKLSGCLCEFKVNNKRLFRIVYKYSDGCFRCFSGEENVNHDVYFTDHFVRVVEMAKE